MSPHEHRGGPSASEDETAGSGGSNDADVEESDPLVIAYGLPSTITRTLRDAAPHCGIRLLEVETGDVRELESVPWWRADLVLATDPAHGAATPERDVQAVHPELPILSTVPRTDREAPLRLLGFDETTPEGADQVAVATGALASAGVHTGAGIAGVLDAAAAAGHLLPRSAGALRRVVAVQQALCNPAPEALEKALRLVRAHADGVDPSADPADLGTRPYPEHGFWSPHTGVTGILHEALSPSTPAGQALPDAVTVLVVGRTWVCSGQDDHVRDLHAALTTEGHTVLGWFGSTDHALTDLEPVLDQISLWISSRASAVTGGPAGPEIDPGRQLLEDVGVPVLSTLVLSSVPHSRWMSDRTATRPSTIAHQIAIPELQGAVAPIVVAVRSDDGDHLVAIPEQCRRVARLGRRLIDLRHTPRHERRLVVVLLAHDPDKGRIGTASMLDVWRSLLLWLQALERAGWSVEVPEDEDALRRAVLEGADGSAAAVPRELDRVPVAQYVRDYPHHQRLVPARGAAPGEFDTDGIDLMVHGARLGAVTVVCQPSFGYGDDPAGLLSSPDAAPTHSFASFYTWLRRHEDPHAILHFGTHGALEFMPGAAVALRESDYSDHLIDDVPHLYYYVVSNPSEGAIARRRSAAALVSYANPLIDRAEVHGALAALRDDVQTVLADLAEARHDRHEVLWERIRSAAHEAGLDSDVDPGPASTADARSALRREYLTALFGALDEVAESLIARGLHVLGQGIAPSDARTILTAAAENGRDETMLPSLLDDPCLDELVDAVIEDRPAPAPRLEAWHRELRGLRDDLAHCPEAEALVAAHDGRLVPPGPPGDPIRHRASLPTGRNTFSVDPLTLPVPRAVRRGREQAERLLEKTREAGGPYPASVAVVMWGIDTVKTLGEAPAQAFALMGAEPRTGPDGRVRDVRLLPLDELDRPRIDVVVQTSGVFRDMFASTLELLDETIRRIAVLDESDEDNHIAAHAREAAADLGIDVAEAATRVFSSAPGLYGTGISPTLAASAWETEADLGSIYLRRQAHTPHRGASAAALRHALSHVEVTYQSIDGPEQSLSDSDDYVEHLGGLTAAVAAVRGTRPRAMTADTSSPRARVRDLDEAMRLEARTRMLNPRWSEAMLEHGFQGTAEIAARIEHTVGWQATTRSVDHWVLSHAARTYLFDDAMRERLSDLNPAAVRGIARTLDEAIDRGLWHADDQEAQQLDDVLDRLEDRCEGVP